MAAGAIFASYGTADGILDIKKKKMPSGRDRHDNRRMYKLDWILGVKTQTDLTHHLHPQVRPSTRAGLLSYIPLQRHVFSSLVNKEEDPQSFISARACGFRLATLRP